MKRLSENPPSRFPPRPIAEATGPWWVAKVKPRMEKALAFDFVRQGVEYYLPLFTKVTRRPDNNKPRKSIMPLFPGYISFAMQTPQNIFITGRVVNIVEVKYQRRFIDELTQVYNALEAGVALEPLAFAYEPGTPVVVSRGPLRGVHGTFVRSGSGRKLVISVDSLGSAAVSIDEALVRPVGAQDGK